jgi:hypothetical protein
LRIWDVYPGSEFSILDTGYRVKNIPDPGWKDSGSRVKKIIDPGKKIFRICFKELSIC